MKARWSFFVCALLAAAVCPAAGPARRAAPGDGTLVVQKASAPTGVPVVTLTIKGTVVGRLTSGSPDLLDTVVIDQIQGSGQFNAEPAGGTRLETTEVTPTTKKYVGSDFRFRAIDANSFRATIYGSGINIFAVGQGTVTLQGMPNQTTNSGRYSLQGQQFQPLPTTPTPWLQLTTPTKLTRPTNTHQDPTAPGAHSGAVWPSRSSVRQEA